MGYVYMSVCLYGAVVHTSTDYNFRQIDHLHRSHAYTRIFDNYVSTLVALSPLVLSILQHWRQITGSRIGFCCGMHTGRLCCIFYLCVFVLCELHGSI